MNNPYEECPDDTICAYCGSLLPLDPKPGNLAFDGFCSQECADNYSPSFVDPNLES